MDNQQETGTAQVLKVSGRAKIDETWNLIEPEPVVTFECTCGNTCRTYGKQGVTCQGCGTEWNVKQ